ncbi:2OG-Fe(II) oxygenase [Spongiactinospora rosea]|uniref:2OG-Fe(II) oxygenase n=1 Tax=Spongiactinospora rosea TaxID=2248750 RepID=A0A366M342_9ACTN|nr:2OG-Fe(II) oxygenase [Spongiactinospora rosea]RBQ20615.1 2OG-Fe(II) oxygenase [Spongiactinospora rosea]
MPTTARERLTELLDGVTDPGASSVHRKLPKSALSVAVDGVGPLRFPISDEQAAQLRRLGRRARFGRGEQTLTDPEVRDTWEIPSDLVHVAWTDAFEGVLDGMRDELGLPPHCRLMPELHSMLLYETGQFFVAHQDSEKDDAMVGTLVVTLPSAYAGGELVIDHRGQATKHRGSRVNVSLVAFYADCRHQVLPVKSGNRITLTYNLLLAGDGIGPVAEGPLVGELADCLHSHFTTPVAPPYGGRAERPKRLAYLLNHEYTARGLSWSRLKGSDAAGVASLRAAAERAGCEATLALAEIQETWDAYDPDEDPWYREHDENEEDPGGHKDSGDADDGRYVLNDLIECTITLAHWIGPETGRLEQISLDLGEAEVASTTPTTDLTPYSSQYEGYMGNYGNTLDRWYRRAALIIWPRSRNFANRAESSPGWALDELSEMARAGEVAKAREAAQSLRPFWNASIQSGRQVELFGRALRTAGALDDAQTAALLLSPFPLELLAPDQAPALARLAARHGDAWIGDLLREWSTGWGFGPYVHAPEPLRWLADLPRLCATLLSADDDTTARHIVDLSWTWFMDRIRPVLVSPLTSRSAAWLTAHGEPLSGIIAAAAQTGSTRVLDGAITVANTGGDQALVLVTAALRVVKPHTAGFGELATGCAERIRASLARPPRTEDDWSIALPAGCECELCKVLGAFLQDPKRRDFDWPLAKEKRRHVHTRIDDAELPIHHETRRLGRPYTLVLTKTEALFERDRIARERHQADLAWLTENRDSFI